MKNDQAQFEAKPDIEIVSELIFCKEKQEAELVCANSQCRKNPFLCFKSTCKCHQQHPKCLKSTKKSIIVALEEKMISYQKIEKKIKQEIQKSIDQLSQMETNLLNQCQQKFKKLIGLTDYDKGFIQALKLGRGQDMSGETIWNIQVNLRRSQKTTKMIDKLQQDINKIWANFSEALQNLSFAITDRILFFGSTLFEDSNIVTTRKQAKIIEVFFLSQEQMIASAKLIYRGSENNFTSSSFHNSCNNYGRTITICQTTYGKKLGGYTQHPWNSGNNYFSDSTGKSFVFSLSNNHKFVPQNNNNSVYCHQGNGPTFGSGNSGHDFYLADSCHQNFNSYFNVNSIYKNPNYISGNAQSHYQMVGSQQNFNFKVKEYEVWQVQLIA